MDKMVSFCGLVCTECPAYLATQADDNEKRKETAVLWSKMYGADIAWEAINCDGCLSTTGRLFGHCHVCEARKCGQEKGYTTCAPCDDFACEKLEPIHKAVPEAKAALEEIRKGR
jgi:hypothetical protein